MFLKKSLQDHAKHSYPNSGPFINPTLQPKLKIGEANDKYEQEADRIADKVVSRSGFFGGESSLKPTPLVQRSVNSEQEIQQKPLAKEVTPLVQMQKSVDEEPLQMKLSREEESIQKKEESYLQRQDIGVETGMLEEPVQMMEEEQVQAKAANTAPQNTSIESRLSNSKGSGQKLSGNVKQEMESGFGSDFGNVTIHNDDNAAQLSDDLGAKAFAHGNDVYFNKGQFNPESSEGKHLLAHELTHTIQQTGMVQKKDETSSSTPSQSEPEFDVEIGFNAFIPNTLNAPIYEDNKAWKPEPNPFSSKFFSSDNRSYSQSGTSRIWQKGFLKFKGEELINRISSQGVGASEQADPIYKIIGLTPIHYGSDTGGRPIKKVVGIENKKSKTAADKGSVSKIELIGYKGFKFLGEASYPFSAIAPDIDFEVSALVKVFKKENDFYVMAVLVGEHNEFPAYQAYLSTNGESHYFYTYRVDKNDGPGMINLNSSDSFTATKMIKLT